MRQFYIILVLMSFMHVFGSAEPDYKIVMTMIVRDEEVNLKSNLKLWTNIIKYFIFLVDTRTIDNSIDTIHSVLNASQSEYKIFANEFDGFGSSRTRSLEAAWKYFPDATHVWISDPDWVVDLLTINMNDLDHSTDVFGFVSYDRTGITTR
jgi:hypothetical protein